MNLGPMNGTSFELEILREDRRAMAEELERNKDIIHRLTERCKHLEQVNILLEQENAEWCKKWMVHNDVEV